MRVVPPVLAALLTSSCAARDGGDPQPGPSAQTTSVLPPARLVGASTRPPIGTDSPVVVEAVDPHGRWVAFCQARVDTDGSGAIAVNVGRHGDTFGDRLTPFLDVEGSEQAIDAYVGSSVDGRWIAVIRAGRLELVDVVTHTRTQLGSAASDDRNAMGSHRAARFDPTGQRMLYVRGPIEVRAAKKRPPHSSIVVRELVSGREREIDVPKALVSRAWFDEDGAHVWASIVDRDTNEDRKLSVPVVGTTLAARGCRGPARSSSSRGVSGDEPTLALAGPTAQRLTPEPGAPRIAGGRLSVREADGFGSSMRVGRAEGERPHDVEPGELVPPPPTVDGAGRVVGHGRIGLYAKAATPPFLYDSASGERFAIDVDLALDPKNFTYPMSMTDSMLAIATKDGTVAIIDLAQAKLLGRVPRLGVALSSKGEVLDGVDVVGRSLLQGPLRWYAPQ